MSEDVFKVKLKGIWGGLRPVLPVVIIFNVTLFAWLYFASSDDVKPARELAIEGVKAIAWSVTTPACEKHGFCHKISKDEDAGTLVKLTVLSPDHALSKGWSEVVTSTGTYVIHGNPIGTHTAGEPVSLYVVKGNQRNVLCINDTCYLVPFLAD